MRVLLAVWIACVLSGGPAAALTSTTFSVEVHVTTHANTTLGAGGTSIQTSLSVCQFSTVGVQRDAPFVMQTGFQPALDGFDTDHDGWADHEDPDADGDGVHDTADTYPYDTDGDGQNNLADGDDDNDQLTDAQEAAAGTSWFIADTDGDSFSDYVEYAVTGTDGSDSNSYLSTRISYSGDQALIAWPSVSGKEYAVQRNSKLAFGDAWSTFAVVVAVSSNTVITDAITNENYSYRVRLSY